MGNQGYALNKACPELQAVYDTCEKKHLNAFKRGEASIDNPCRDQWEDYKQCVMEVWDSKTQDYLQRRAAARGEMPPSNTAPEQPSSTTAAPADITLPQPSPASSSPPTATDPSTFGDSERSREPR